MSCLLTSASLTVLRRFLNDSGHQRTEKEIVEKTKDGAVERIQGQTSMAFQNRMSHDVSTVSQELSEGQSLRSMGSKIGQDSFQALCSSWHCLVPLDECRWPPRHQLPKPKPRHSGYHRSEGWKSQPGCIFKCLVVYLLENSSHSDATGSSRPSSRGGACKIKIG